MFERFRNERAKARANAAIVDELFGAIAAAARHPAHYTRHGVTDTVMGRYEMLVLHTWLFLHRARGGSAALETMAQDVVDTLFRELDSTLREIGIGDTSVPKRMKKLARMVYGRWEAYGEALDGSDYAALAGAIERNVYSEGGDARGAGDLADYVRRSETALRSQPDDALLSGWVRFADPVVSAVA